ncbi:type II toxin-antitoxin system HicB family antitoxin [Endothiovibrio diazotrophicus]
MTSYIALLRKESGTDYGVDFPDFPGCIAAGEDMEEARVMAKQALLGHALLLQEEGEALPEPSKLEAVMADPANHDAVAFLVTVPDPRSRAVRVNVSLPEILLGEVDAEAKRLGTSRSGYLASAAREYIARHRSRST